MNNTEKDLTVYPVKIDDENMDIVDKYPLPPIPFFLVILGRVKAGKSNLLNNLTLSPRFYGNDFQIKILISPTLHDPINKNMVEQFDFVFEEYRYGAKLPRLNWPRLRPGQKGQATP